MNVVGINMATYAAVKMSEDGMRLLKKPEYLVPDDLIHINIYLIVKVTGTSQHSKSQVLSTKLS